MKSLLSIEWMKLRRYRTFWILISLFAILLPVWNLFIKSGILKIGGGGVNVLSSVYSFGYVWENLGFWASMFVWFLSILVIIITTNEYQFRTNRQNVIDGWSRLDFYHAKWSVILMMSVATTVYVFIVGLLIALSNSGLSGFPGNLEYLFYVFLLSLNYYGFCLIISIFFKRSGLAIGMFIFYCMIIETLLKYLLEYKLDGAGRFLPLQASDELLPFPILDMVKAMAQIKSAPSAIPCVIASLVWIGIYYFVGRQKLTKSDW